MIFTYKGAFSPSLTFSNSDALLYNNALGCDPPPPPIESPTPHSLASLSIVWNVSTLYPWQGTSFAPTHRKQKDQQPMSRRKLNATSCFLV